MKRYLILFGLLVGLLGSVSLETKAQIIDGAYVRTDAYKRKPTPLPYVREADVMWSKKVGGLLTSVKR